MESKLVICITILNGHPYLPECIDSIIHQQGNFEADLVLVDAGSTDGSRAWLQAFQSSYKNENGSIHFSIKLLEKTGGIYECLKYGFDQSVAPIMYYLGSDDRLMPDSLKRAVEFFEKHPNQHLLTGIPANIDENGQRIYEFVPLPYMNLLVKYGMYGNILPIIHAESIFFTRYAWQKVNHQTWSQLKWAGDFYLWKQITDTGIRFVHMSEVLCESRIHDKRKGKIHKVDYLEEMRVLTAKPGNTVRLTAKVWKYLNLLLPNVLIKKMYFH